MKEKKAIEPSSSREGKPCSKRTQVRLKDLAREGRGKRKKKEENAGFLEKKGAGGALDRTVKQTIPFKRRGSIQRHTLAGGKEKKGSVETGTVRDCFSFPLGGGGSEIPFQGKPHIKPRGEGQPGNVS